MGKNCQNLHFFGLNLPLSHVSPPPLTNIWQNINLCWWLNEFWFSSEEFNCQRMKQRKSRLQYQFWLTDRIHQQHKVGGRRLGLPRKLYIRKQHALETIGGLFITLHLVACMESNNWMRNCCLGVPSKLKLCSEGRGQAKKSAKCWLFILLPRLTTDDSQNK